MALSQKRGKTSDKMSSSTLKALLKWYEAMDRDVPWRVGKGQKADPYKVWLSEIMCQQTTVQAVKPYFLKFTTKWPDIKTLAAAPETDVLSEWAGLGYYARARNLHKCAQQINTDHKGKFPQDQDALRKLAGIGEYTSAAIAAIAFNKQTVIIDGNVDRVLARFFAVQTPFPAAKPLIRQYAEQLYLAKGVNAAELAQALMDLGAKICIPKAPRCPQCPIASQCKAKKQGIATELPRKLAKKPKPQRHGYVYWIENNKGEVLFQRRPDKGLLAGMIGLPTGDWVDNTEPLSHATDLKSLSLQSKNNNLGCISHVFTHFDLELEALSFIRNKPAPTPSYFWAAPEEVKSALPSVFAKAYNLFQRQHVNVEPNPE
jgi:A/G-specific adenine glycosylase